MTRSYRASRSIESLRWGKTKECPGYKAGSEMSGRVYAHTTRSGQAAEVQAQEFRVTRSRDSGRARVSIAQHVHRLQSSLQHMQRQYADSKRRRWSGSRGARGPRSPEQGGTRGSVAGSRKDREPEEEKAP